MSNAILMRTHRRVRPRRRKMIQTKFLITGATGSTGGYTVRQLLEKNQAVRVLAHRSDERSEQLQKVGAEIVFGDFLDFDAVRAALNEVQRAYFCYPISPGIVQATAQFAGFLGSLCELRGRLHDAWADRIAEVGTLHFVQRGTHSVKIEEVPEHDLSANLLQLL